MNEATKTTYADAHQQFTSRSATAQRLMTRWRADEHHQSVVPFVEGHVTSVLYGLSNEDVRATCESTDHALGDVKKSVADAVLSIRDWHPAFAFIHVFHYALESSGALPTYQGFRQMCESDAFLRSALLKPSQDAVKEAIEAGVPRAVARDAMRWRVGNAYYSFLREVYTIVALRTAGLDVRYHVLPDALYAVDCWHGETAISLFIGNAKFKGAASGRKGRAEDVLSDATPPLRFLDVRLPVAHVFGEVHLPPKDEVEKLVALLSATS